jgi:small-conductance mechanosensitive channel
MIRILGFVVAWVVAGVVLHHVRRVSNNALHAAGMRETTEYRLLRWVGAIFLGFIGAVALLSAVATLLDGVILEGLIALGVAAVFLALAVWASPRDRHPRTA